MRDAIALAGPASAGRRRRVPFPALVAGLLVGLSGLIAVHELHGAASFDEGVYLNSLRALERGAPLGRQVFASQPPGFYLWLRFDALVFPGSLTGLRLGFVALGLAGCVSVFALGRLYSGVLGGALSALFFATAGPVVGLTARVSPDLAAVSVSLVGVALVAHVWEARVSRSMLDLPAAFLGGAALAAAMTIKLDGMFAVLGVCALAVVVRPPARRLLAALAGFVLALVCVLAPFVGVASQLWRSVVSFHLNARSVAHAGGSSGVRANAAHIAASFEPRSSVVIWLILLGIVILVVQGIRGIRAQRRALWLLVWPFAAFVFLLWQTPLFSHHVVLLAGAAAVPAGVGLAGVGGPARWHRTVAAAAVLAAALSGYAEWVAQPVQPEPSSIRAATSLLRRASPPNSYALATDDPIVVFLAHRAVPPNLVDTSWVRLSSGSLTRSEILARARADHVAAVLAGPRLLGSAAVRNALRRLFPNHVQIDRKSALYLARRTSATKS